MSKRLINVLIVHLCACWLYAASFFHVCCSIHLRSWSPWQQHVCSVCARDTPLVLTQRHLLLWDVTGQKHEMQIVPTELPIVINRRLVT